MALQQFPEPKEILRGKYYNLMRKALVGMPGSGKSRMAKFISSVTDLSYKDLDDEIERTEGKSIKEIFKTMVKLILEIRKQKF